MNFITILIFILVIALYGLICYYIGYNGWVWLKTTFLSKFKKTYISFIIILSLSIFAGQLLTIPFLETIGGIWMAIIAFSLILLPFINLIVFFLKKKGIFWIGLTVVGLFVFLFGYGAYNAWSPVVRNYEVQIDKKANVDELKIVMASDFHSGSIVGVNHLERFVALVEKEEPDMVFIPGDIIDDNIGPFLKHKMGDVLGKIKAPLGVYAVLGNHDYYGNDTESLLNEMNRIGIKVLMDEYITVDNQFVIAGRKEHTDETRKKINEFMHGLDPKIPVIMMDHQPKDLDEAKDSGVDLLLSGHTHGGQIFPANFVTNMIFENDYGYLKKENLHSIVSSGFGTWGPPLRVGTRSEVLVIDVKFTE